MYRHTAKGENAEELLKDYDHANFDVGATPEEERELEWLFIRICFLVNTAHGITLTVNSVHSLFESQRNPHGGSERVHRASQAAVDHPDRVLQRLEKEGFLRIVEQ